MKSSKNCKVTAAFLAAAALGGVAHAEPTLNMNDLVGSNTTTESTAQGNNIATPVVWQLSQSYQLHHNRPPLYNNKHHRWHNLNHPT